MSTIHGRVAVVTGAGSGIGRALALELARRGAKLALSDINEAGVAETASQAKALGSADVISGKLDVSDRAAFFAYADEASRTSASSIRSTTTPGSPSRARCSRPTWRTTTVCSASTSSA